MSTSKRKCRICLKWKVRGKQIQIGTVGMPGAFEFECEKCLRDYPEDAR